MRRLRGPHLALGRLDARTHELQARLTRIEAALADLGAETRAAAQATRAELADTHALVSGELRAGVRAIVSEESANRRRLHELRAESAYDAAWDQPRPLVTVTVATRDRAELLVTRSLPSILAQTHGELEVIVVGDHTGQDTADAIRELGDPRVTYSNLTQHLHFTDDPYRHWLVASTMARNEANRLARGSWLVCFDDDDSMRPDCIERLLARALAGRFEVVYGQALAHPDADNELIVGAFPPALGRFTWVSAMYHSGLRFFERELFAADLDLPGDWFKAERMLRAGVRFGMVPDAVLADIYPLRFTIDT
jgi:Glycosyl transferase family 2